MKKRDNYEFPMTKVMEIDSEAALLAASGDKLVDNLNVIDEEENPLDIIIGGGGGSSIWDR